VPPRVQNEVTAEASDYLDYVSKKRYILSTMIQRTLKISKFQSFFLLGPRGVGKSTLLKSSFAEEKCLWLNLLNPEIEHRYAARPARILEDWDATPADVRRNGWIVIDEIQRIPKILDLVHLGIEEKRIKFALTGSSARKLRRGASNLLAGRAVEFRLHPFSSFELSKEFELEDALNWGTLPRAVELKTEPVERRRFLTSYVNTYLREEIQAEQLVRKVEPFRLFLEIAAAANGSILNVSKLARQSGVEPRTAQRYFEVILDTLIGFFLPSFNRSVRQRQASHPKFYFFDTGVVRAALQVLDSKVLPGTYEFGKLFENFVILEAMKANDYAESGFSLSYFRSADGAEIDLIATKGTKKVVAIEIKSTQDPDISDVRKLARISREIHGSTPYIFCLAKQPSLVEGVRIVPWQLGIQEVFLTPVQD